MPYRFCRSTGLPRFTQRFSEKPPFPPRRPLVAALALLGILTALCAIRAIAQYTPPAPPPPPGEPGPMPPPPGPLLAPAQLDQLVQRIALYPDPLLAQVLTASTYWEQIPDAAAWVNQHSFLQGDALANAIQTDNLQWDPSVLALLPFPSVLNMMAQDPNWTQQLGTAVLSQRPDVMDAVQRMREQAYRYGYLRTTPYDTVVSSGGYIQILPVNPSYIYVPSYDSVAVFSPPPPGFAISGAIRFGPSIVIGPAFAPWGWVAPGILWGTHTIVIDHTPWNRVWVNRGYYVHPYAQPWVHAPGPRVEHHETHR